MEYSSAMNNLGGIIAITLSSFLATFNWRYSFGVYLLGLLGLILILIFLPDTHFKSSKTRLNGSIIRKIYPYSIAIFMIVVMKDQLFDLSLIGIVLAIETLGAFIVGMKFNLVESIFKDHTKYLSAIMFIVGYLLLSVTSHIILIIIGLLSIGVGLGVGVPLLNSKVALKTGTEEVASIMAIMSAMLYLGQFISPLIVQLFQNIIGINSIKFPYYFGIALSFILLAGVKHLKIEHVKTEPKEDHIDCSIVLKT